MFDENPIYGKIRKLLALSQNEGATEAEASAAALKVQELCQDYGLDLAQIGDDPGKEGRREAGTIDRRAMYSWQQRLMSTLAECNFCLHDIRKEKIQRRTKVRNSKRHFLVGRKLNVDVVTSLYDYLVGAMKRFAEQDGHSGSQLFMEGATSRLTDRLKTQKREREQEEARRRDEARARGEEVNALVVTDVYNSERDLNNDALNGFPAGTTAARREKHKTDVRAREEREAELIKSGMDSTVAYYVSHGYEKDRAEALVTESKKNQMKRSKRQRRSSNRWGSGTTSFRRGSSKHAKKYSSPAFQSGMEAGDKISLNRQAGHSESKKIG